MAALVDNTDAERILRYLDWHVVRRLDGAVQGDFRSLFYGPGLDFSDLREYQPQDDFRHIDWNVTARTNVLHVRKYMEDRDVAVWFLVDLSSSMKFGGRGRHKHVVMSEVIGTLARIVSNGGHRIGAVFYDDEVKLAIAPRAGRPQVLRLVSELYQTRPFRGGKTTDLKPLLEFAVKTIKRRSLVFLVSDFLSVPGWEGPLNLLARRHDLLPIRIWDPTERELPDVGVVLVEDSETGEQLTVDTRDSRLRQRFIEASQRWERDLAHAFKQASVEALFISTNEDWVRSIIRFAGLRKRTRYRPQQV